MVERLKYITNIVIVALLFATVAIQRDARVLGTDIATINQDSPTKIEIPTETTLDDGIKVVNTTTLGKDIVGFNGTTPVRVYFNEDKIQKIEVEPNSETPSFFDKVLESGLLNKWDGLSLTDAATLKVDVVSGATYSSAAVIENIKLAIEHEAKFEATSNSLFADLDLKDYAGIFVILMGVFVTFLRTRNKVLLIILQLLNIIVLGFWCGSFLSLATFTTWMANGINLSISIVAFAMLCVVLIAPLFGKKGSFCQMHCPLGSAQELLWQIPLTKTKINPRATKFLNSLRYYILAALLFMMWLGVGFEIMDYEIFSAFIVSSASTVVLCMASTFLTLSLFVHRPYCRFVCPTGAIITLSQKVK